MSPPSSRRRALDISPLRAAPTRWHAEVRGRGNLSSSHADPHLTPYRAEVRSCTPLQRARRPAPQGGRSPPSRIPISSASGCVSASTLRLGDKLSSRRVSSPLPSPFEMRSVKRGRPSRPVRARSSLGESAPPTAPWDPTAPKDRYVFGHDVRVQARAGNLTNPESHPKFSPILSDLPVSPPPCQFSDLFTSLHLGRPTLLGNPGCQGISI